MSKIRIVASIGVVSFREYLHRKAQVSGIAPVEDALFNVFTPEQLKVLSSPSSLEKLGKVISEFPEIMNTAVNQVNQLPKEKYLQGEYFLEQLLQYFDHIKWMYQQFQEASKNQEAQDELLFEEPVVEQELMFEEPVVEKQKPTPQSLLDNSVTKLSEQIAALFNLAQSLTDDSFTGTPADAKDAVTSALADVQKAMEGAHYSFDKLSTATVGV